ncbi:MAG TPA: hypothetical protein VGE07_18325 [Herpetosiphonaceae bacterium]
MKPFKPLLKFAAVATMLAGLAAPALAAPDFANSSFSGLWTRQDKAVAERMTDRSWTWGPAPITGALREQFAEGAEGKRTVQYFDKSRMEINDPTLDPNSEWYVTNGLLPVEMITGRMAVGLNLIEFRGPAPVSAIGDPGFFPTYADLLPVYNTGPVRPGDVGKPATGMLVPGGKIEGFADYAGDKATVLNDQGVAQAFVDFQNTQGLIWRNGRYVRSQVYNPLFVFGKPITGAFWVKTMVAGKEQPVLFQVFERRVLTYNPANPAAFRVEMGNVGQHYYRWRYGQ